jgi:hypothetical protein
MSPVATSIAGRRATVTDPRILRPSLSKGQECVMEVFFEDYYHFDVFDAAHGAHAEALSIFRKASASGPVDPSSPVAIAASEAEEFIVEKCKLKRASLWGFLKNGSWRAFIGEVIEEEESTVSAVHVGKHLANFPVIIVGGGAPSMHTVLGGTVISKTDKMLTILDTDGSGEEYEVPIDVASRFFTVPVEIVNIASAAKPLAAALKRLPVSSDSKLFAADQMCLLEFRAVVEAASIPASIAAQVWPPSSPPRPSSSSSPTSPSPSSPLASPLHLLPPSLSSRPRSGGRSRPRPRRPLTCRGRRRSPCRPSRRPSPPPTSTRSPWPCARSPPTRLCSCRALSAKLTRRSLSSPFARS